MKTVLIPTDFGPTAMNAEEYAIQLFSKDQVNYHLLNTYYEPPSGAGFLVSIVDTLRKDSENCLEKEKHAILLKFPYLGKSITTESRHGYLHDSILDAAKDNDPDYIVMGTKGSRGIEKILFKSNTHNIVGNRRYPIIVVPDGYNFEPPKTIILATDLHISTNKALEPLIDIAKKFNSHIKVVNIKRFNEELSVAQSAKELEIDRVLADVDHSFYEIESDHIQDALEAFIDVEQGDLLALIPHKHSGWERLFHHSVTKEMTLQAEMPLLILPEQK